MAQVQKRVLKKYNQKYVGQVLQVVVEGYHPESKLLMRGRHAGQCPDIDGQVIINRDAHKVKAFGEIYSVEITEALEYDLVGRIL